jgi:hypothetical protein
MLDVLLDTTVDALKILPFLYITYLVLEFAEHKMSEKTKNIVKKSGKIGPLYGGIVRNITTMWFFYSGIKFIC